ncbi:helix-turn-helix domain-containing protein [Sporomusa aerivorans]|uniref:helix-turn-helix domain-containing protein n=1 Tax=Sporomusa aerivorans TaxID=204936 RepID=UPI00352AE491
MKNLTKIMKLKDMSGYELAKRSDVSQSHISDIIHGKKQPTLPVAKRIADALGVTIDDLIGDKPKKLQKTG